MKVYLDLIIVLNFFYDTLIVLAVSVLLKEKVEMKRVFLSSLIGEIALITLFVRLDNIYLLLLKIILSLIMVFISFLIYYIVYAVLGPEDCEGETRAFSLNGNNWVTKSLLAIKEILNKKI